MDLLGSILNAMDKPPSVNSANAKAMKKQREEMLKRQKEEKENLRKFREKIEEKIKAFVQDDKMEKMPFKPMEKRLRSIVHDVAEVAGLAAYSFGEEEVDRAVTVYKKEFVPCEEELAVLRRGGEWDPVKAKEEALQRELERQQEERDRKEKKTITPNSNYQEKYHHLIGKEAAIEAARRTETNKQYGFVPSANKKDQRSIEQTLADIQSKKRLKTSHTAADGSASEPTSSSKTD